MAAVLLCHAVLLGAARPALTLSLVHRFSNLSRADVTADPEQPPALDHRLLPLYGGEVGHDTWLDDWTRRHGQGLLQLLRRIGDSNQTAATNLADKYGKYQDPVPSQQPLPCPANGTRSAARPSSVHRLRPGDIDVVAAIGDSLTAANGAAATNVVQLFTTNRGLAWDIGGQGTWRRFLTLPNILKEFNPRLVGFSLGDTLYSVSHANQQLNVAEPAGVTADTLSMARSMVDKMKHDPRIDFAADWKLVTIMVGAVDLCFDVCYHKDPWNAAARHRKSIEKALDYLLAHCPRTLVNLAVVPNAPETISNLRGMPALCRFMYHAQCPCAISPVFAAIQKQYLKIGTLFQQAEMDLAEQGKYQRREDFAVVAQPFFVGSSYPLSGRNTTDWRNLAPDCFHASQRGHAMAANALWNNMLEPVGAKTQRWDLPFATFRCPTADRPYFFTHGNSRTTRITADD